MEPVFFYQRILRCVGAVVATLATGVIWYLGWWFLFVMPHDDDDGTGTITAMAVAGLIGAVLLAWRLAGKMVASVNIESITDRKGLFARLMS